MMKVGKNPVHTHYVARPNVAFLNATECRATKMSPPNVATAKFYNSGPDLFTSGLFEVKIGVASWVSRGRRPRPAAKFCRLGNRGDIRSRDIRSGDIMPLYQKSNGLPGLERVPGIFWFRLFCHSVTSQVQYVAWFWAWSQLATALFTYLILLRFETTLSRFYYCNV
jgi:hypothetical protein